MVRTPPVRGGVAAWWTMAGPASVNPTSLSTPDGHHVIPLPSVCKLLSHKWVHIPTLEAMWECLLENGAVQWLPETHTSLPGCSLHHASAGEAVDADTMDTKTVSIECPMRGWPCLSARLPLTTSFTWQAPCANRVQCVVPPSIPIS